ncbi:11020_t:CDS:2, partial [Acaulospora colombiana]
GKGLVLNGDGPDIEEGEILWKEEPWVLTSDWDVLSQLQQTSLCAHCSCPLYLRNPNSIIRCDHCVNASSSSTIRSLSAFCNRLCYSRAQSSYHPFLCPGQNPACEPLLELLKANDWSAPHSLARVTGKLLSSWRDAQIGSGSGGGVKKDGGISWESECKFFDALAAWSLEDKWRAENKEITAAERAKWKQAYELYVATFHMPTSTEGKKKLAQVMKRQGPLPDQLFKKLFTYDAFMLNVGRINLSTSNVSHLSLLPTTNVSNLCCGFCLDRESYGGLYFLHSHINHSCRPNAAIRHLDLPGRVDALLQQGNIVFSPATLAKLKATQITNPSPTRLTVLTLRRITGGEEVTVSYIDPTLSLKERRRELRQWGIMSCTCDRCVEEEKAAGEVKGDVPEESEGSGGKGVEDLEGELRGATFLISEYISYRALECDSELKAQRGDVLDIQLISASLLDHRRNWQFGNALAHSVSGPARDGGKVTSDKAELDVMSGFECYCSFVARPNANDAPHGVPVEHLPW